MKKFFSIFAVVFTAFSLFSQGLVYNFYDTTPGPAVDAYILALVGGGGITNGQANVNLGTSLTVSNLSGTTVDLKLSGSGAGANVVDLQNNPGGFQLSYGSAPYQWEFYSSLGFVTPIGQGAAGNITAGNLFVGNGSGITNVNAATLNGNPAGTFLVAGMGMYAPQPWQQTPYPFMPSIISGGPQYTYKLSSPYDVIQDSFGNYTMNPEAAVSQLTLYSGNKLWMARCLVPSNAVTMTVSGYVAILSNAVSATSFAIGIRPQNYSSPSGSISFTNPLPNATTYTYFSVTTNITSQDYCVYAFDSSTSLAAITLSNLTVSFTYSTTLTNLGAVGNVTRTEVAVGNYQNRNLQQRGFNYGWDYRLLSGEQTLIFYYQSPTNGTGTALTLDLCSTISDPGEAYSVYVGNNLTTPYETIKAAGGGYPYAVDIPNLPANALTRIQINLPANQAGSSSSVRAIINTNTGSIFFNKQENSECIAIDGTSRMSSIDATITNLPQYKLQGGVTRLSQLGIVNLASAGASMAFEVQNMGSVISGLAASGARALFTDQDGINDWPSTSPAVTTNQFASYMLTYWTSIHTFLPWMKCYWYIGFPCGETILSNGVPGVGNTNGYKLSDYWLAAYGVTNSLPASYTNWLTIIKGISLCPSNCLASDNIHQNDAGLACSAQSIVYWYTYGNSSQTNDNYMTLNASYNGNGGGLTNILYLTNSVGVSGTITAPSTYQSATIYLSSGSTITSITVALPTTTVAGQMFYINAKSVVTSLTVTGTSFTGTAATALTAGQTIGYQALDGSGNYLRIE